jgi:hypothetical protein
MEGVCSIRVIDIDNSRLRSDVCHGGISSNLSITMRTLHYHWKFHQLLIVSSIHTELVSMSYHHHDMRNAAYMEIVH